MILEVCHQPHQPKGSRTTLAPASTASHDEYTSTVSCRVNSKRIAADTIADPNGTLAGLAGWCCFPAPPPTPFAFPVAGGGGGGAVASLVDQNIRCSAGSTSPVSGSVYASSRKGKTLVSTLTAVIALRSTKGSGSSNT